MSDRWCIFHRYAGYVFFNLVLPLIVILALIIIIMIVPTLFMSMCIVGYVLILVELRTGFKTFMNFRQHPFYVLLFSIFSSLVLSFSIFFIITSPMIFIIICLVCFILVTREHDDVNNHKDGSLPSRYS